MKGKKPNGKMYIDGQHVADCFVYCKREDANTMSVGIRGTPRPMSIKEKYNHAILVLQAIAQRSGGCKNGGFDEWTESEAFRDCRYAAARALKYLGEPRTMPNRRGNAYND